MTNAPSATAELEAWLVAQLAQRLGLAPEHVQRDATFDELGLDSLEAITLSGDLERHLELRLEPTALWRHRTIALLAAYLVAEKAARRTSMPAPERAPPRAPSVRAPLPRGGSVRGGSGIGRAPSTVGRRPERVGADVYTEYTYDMFLPGGGVEAEEVGRFDAWVHSAKADGVYCFERPRRGAQRAEVEIAAHTPGVSPSKVLNFSSYNYLGFAHHPEVIEAAKAALDRYGLGAGSSPVSGGTFELHKALEARLVSMLGLPGRGASLFSSGYAVNTGTISALMGPGHCVVLDEAAHASIVEGAQLSRAHVALFRHNDPAHLEQILAPLADKKRRILVCVEGVYSADGDFGALAQIVPVCRRYGAKILVDEAHSILVAGERGRGVAEEQGVLSQIDLFVLTFSKALGGVGGALIAKEDLTQYVNWYARCRMFSCAMDPAVAGGVNKALELATGPEGERRRHKIRENAEHLRALLRPHVNLGPSESWIVPVIYGAERLTLPLASYLQAHGLDGGMMQFPAVPRNEARIRLFVTAEHTQAQIERGVEIIRHAAAEFGFARRAS